MAIPTWNEGQNPFEWRWKTEKQFWLEKKTKELKFRDVNDSLKTIYGEIEKCANDTSLCEATAGMCQRWINRAMENISIFPNTETTIIPAGFSSNPATDQNLQSSAWQHFASYHPNHVNFFDAQKYLSLTDSSERFNFIADTMSGVKLGFIFTYFSYKQGLEFNEDGSIKSSGFKNYKMAGNDTGLKPKEAHNETKFKQRMRWIIQLWWWLAGSNKELGEKAEKNGWNWNFVGDYNKPPDEVIAAWSYPEDFSGLWKKGDEFRKYIPSHENYLVSHIHLFVDDGRGNITIYDNRGAKDGVTKKTVNTGWSNSASPFPVAYVDFGAYMFKDIKDINSRGLDTLETHRWTPPDFED